MTMVTYRVDEAFAREMDAADPLRAFRDAFHIPRAADISGSASGTPGRLAASTPSVYLVGNSLGLQPKSTCAALEEDLEAWARLGVEGHFHAKHPWFPAHEEVRGMLARVVGALPREVVAMNSLTTNLHLLMVSFYRPTRERYKIVIEDTAFPSDSYAVQSQIEFHARHAGFDPGTGLIRLRARDGETSLRTDDILSAIDRDKAAISLVLLGGVNYLTGQLFDIPTITRFAKERGIVVGWDLAHAAGNVDVRLHDDGPDFAAWCSYKYLNSGPGSIAGAFVHERHLDPTRSVGVPIMPRFAGWWGNDPATRFTMGPNFEPVASADAWQLSNPPVFALTPLRTSLEIFDKATMPALREKSRRLTGYMEFLVEAKTRGELRASPNAGGPTPHSLPEGGGVRILTPRDPVQRGCQLSLVLPGDAKRAFKRLQAAGVVCDFREPNVVRAAPVPLYNSFHDVWRFVEALVEAVA